MIAILRRFMIVLLARTMAGARSRRKTGTHFSGSRSKPGILQAPMAPKNEARPKGPGASCSLRRNIVRKRQKTMVCLAVGYPIFAGPAASIAFFGVRIDAPQHLFEVALDRLIAETGPDAQGLGVADHDGAAAGFQNAVGLEGLDHPAGIAAADPQQGRQLLMGQRHDVVAVGALHRRDDPFGG